MTSGYRTGKICYLEIPAADIAQSAAFYQRCFGIELEPKYVDVAIARFEKMTGRQAIHAATGLTFSELKKQRKTTSSTLALPATCQNTETDHV